MGSQRAGQDLVTKPLPPPPCRQKSQECVVGLSGKRSLQRAIEVDGSSSTLAPCCLTAPSPEGFLTPLRVCFLIYKMRKQYLPVDGRAQLYVIICLMHNP